MFSALPSFNAAKRYGLMLLVIGVVFAVIGAVLFEWALAYAEASWYYSIPFPPTLGCFGIALWIAGAGFLSAAILSFVRQRRLATESGTKAPIPADSHQTEQAFALGRPRWRVAASRLLSWSKSWIPNAEWFAGWPPVLATMLFAALALAAVITLWPLEAVAAFDPLTLQLFGGGLVVAAFPLLVLERTYANISADLLPEAPQLDRLLRIPLTACIGLAISLILTSVGFTWAFRIEQATAIFIGIVSVELILRGAAIIFVPFAPIERRRSVADSGIAGAFLRLSLPNLKTINITVRRQFGIDLSRSWALAFIQKAALPIFAGIGIFAWCVTGVTSLGLNERGIYERLGAPVAVFGPGLHVHLPWPLGVVRPVEIGVVHLLPIEFLLPGGAAAEKSSSIGADGQRQLAGAEDPPSAEADRLWTDSHPYEGSYIIASTENGRQSFQLVDIDMAVTYRVGLSDEAARDAAYRVTDIDELIQALSGQLLVRYFTQNTLLDLLGKSRETFAKQFQTALQEQLDHFSTGVEAIGVSVEAIHPPPGAANAYHDVQAAEIRANTQISTSRGEAIRSTKSAELSALQNRNEAAATAMELVGQAQSDGVLFDGDRQAYTRDGQPFLMERWLDNLTKGLGKSEIVLIDHRLTGPSMPTLDLRKLSGSLTNEEVPAATPNLSSSVAPQRAPSAAPQTPKFLPPPSGAPPPPKTSGVDSDAD